MCGIIGAISLEYPINPLAFDIARDTLRHRGPDAKGSIYLQNGYVAIGHRRLSILDLSEAANQPMHLDDLWVTFNGEIYNYRELRKELEMKGCFFHTNTDTEILLHGYKVWGKKICDHLTGMFAFAIWDNANKNLFLARDHIGQKPLYYAHINKQFVIASEIKAITSLLSYQFPMRLLAVADFLIYDFIPEPYTWYEGIYALLPGHCMNVQMKSQSFDINISEYWKFRPNSEPTHVTHKIALDTMGQYVEDAVNSHLLADVKIGAFLSGGVDSGCVVTLASQYLSYPLHTFSIGYNFSPEDERQRAKQVAESTGAIYHDHVIGPTEFQNGMSSLFETFDQPFGDTSLVPTSEVAKLASQNVKVVMTGDGGDEVFGGYWNMGKYMNFPPFKSTSFNELTKHIKIRLSGLKQWQSSENFGHLKNSMEYVNSIIGPALTHELKHYDGYWYYHQHWLPELDPFRRAQWLDLKTYLPSDVLVKVDRCTMRYSLEARPPLLSHKLVEFMLNLPTEVRNPNGEFKGLFRKWLSDKLPMSVLNAPKQGFGIPDQLPQSYIINNFKSHELRTCQQMGLLNPDSLPLIKTLPGVELAWHIIEHMMERKNYVTI